MKYQSFLAAAWAFAVLACGPSPEAPEAAAQNVSSAAVSATERAAILSVMNLRADTRGMVENECGEKVTPQFTPIDLGVGRTILLAMSGGPNSASCYGDGPGLTLLRQSSAAWRPIYSSRGAFMVVMPSRHNGANDLVEAGAGFSHPLYIWNGTEYASANRMVADQQTATGALYPQ